MLKRYFTVGLFAASLSFYSCQKSEQESTSHEGEMHHHGGEMHHEESSAEAVIGVAEVVPGNYGEEIMAEGAISLADLVQEVEANGSYEGKIQGEILDVCTSKGCWLTMQLPDGESIRVTFKDYGFFVPTNSKGFPIVLEGVANFSETDVETLRHYAKDAGKGQEEIDAIVSPKREITFEATGVVIQEKA